MSGGYTHIKETQLAIEEAVHRREGLLHADAKFASVCGMSGGRGRPQIGFNLRRRFEFCVAN